MDIDAPPLQSPPLPPARTLPAAPNVLDSAAIDDRDVLVLAGAGSGKTRALVNHYLRLLERERSPQELVAITFTEKAAREMRGRVRKHVDALAAEAGPDKARWAQIAADMDGARIGTIHGLCAEIVRAHPAEAQVDPQFAVLDEPQAAILRAQAAEEALVWASGDADAVQLFALLPPAALTAVVLQLLTRRLDLAGIAAASPADQRCEQLLQHLLVTARNDPALNAAVAQLHALREAGQLSPAAPEAASAVLDDWQRVAAALSAGDRVAAAQSLFALRRRCGNFRSNARDPAARQLAALRVRYDELVDPWLGGAAADDLPPDAAEEMRGAEDLRRLWALAARALGSYRAALARQHCLDYDGLEETALALLDRPGVCSRWQAQIRAVLVDEFQDTNDRQRRLIMHLCGGVAGRRFLVGDTRQSIYRFRGADVSVFRRVHNDMQRTDGVVATLTENYRGHRRLLRATDDLLERVMGTADDPQRPFAVPFQPLTANRQAPAHGVEPPFLECHFGAGATADAARVQMAHTLARRLRAMHSAGQIRAWDEVALLFRATASFGVYEDALEAHGIPFVTVAGRGFYNRPEVRDLLAIVRALADPADNQMLAGALRSPAFGLTDAALMQLCGDAPQSLRAALYGDLSALDAADQQRA
ncbi:MAG: UvrD-helicase domain-containing protein, partial [Chloroflexales bacterium]|nr:UvrD-helicase domain-containing protein [Chloroflexales bacterium]